MKKTIAVTISILIISLVSTQAISLTINPSIIFEIENETYKVNQIMNFDKIEFTVRETPGWIKFNDTGFYVTSINPVDITLVFLSSDIPNANLNEKVLSFFVKAYNNIQFGLSGFHADNTYRINKNGNFLIEIEANTLGYIEFSNDILDNELFEIFYTKEALLTNYYPHNESTKNQRPPTNISIDVNKTNYDIYIYYLSRTSWPNTIQLLASALNQDGDSFVIPSLANWENEFIWGNISYYWWVNVYDGDSWLNKSYWYKTKGSRYDVTNSGDVTSSDLSIVWLNRQGMIPYDGIYDVDTSGDVTSSDFSLVWVNRT